MAPIVIPPFAFNVYRVKGDRQLEWFGGASTVTAANDIAIGVYGAWQGVNVAMDHAVIVIDASNNRISTYVGHGGSPT